MLPFQLHCQPPHLQMSHQPSTGAQGAAARPANITAAAALLHDIVLNATVEATMQPRCSCWSCKHHSSGSIRKEKNVSSPAQARQCQNHCLVSKCNATHVAVVSGCTAYLCHIQQQPLVWLHVFELAGADLTEKAPPLLTNELEEGRNTAAQIVRGGSSSSSSGRS
jgi:hypothetical protein